MTMAAVPRHRRRVVDRAIRTGALLHDPDDAKLVLGEAAAMRRRAERAGRWPFLLGRLVLIAWVVVALALALADKRLGAIPESSAVVAAIVLSLDLWSLVQLKRRAARAAAAEERHRTHLHGLGLLTADEETALTAPPKPRFRPSLIDAARLCYASFVLSFFLLVPVAYDSPWWVGLVDVLERI
jgi:hypothetical protein